MYGVEVVVYDFHVSVWRGPVVAEFGCFFKVVDMLVSIRVPGQQLYNFRFKAVNILV